jgi:hypothetical protein
LQGLAVSIQTFWLFSLPCWLQTWWNLKFFRLHVFAVHFYILHLRKSQVSCNYLSMFLSFCVQGRKLIENCLLAFKTIYSERKLSFFLCSRNLMIIEKLLWMPNEVILLKILRCKHQYSHIWNLWSHEFDFVEGVVFMVVSWY